MAMRVVPNAAAAQLTRDRVELLGTQVDRVPLDAIGAWITAFIESGQPHQIVTANLDFIAVARKRPPFAKVIAEAALVVCDGKPLVWAARLQGSPIPARVTGMDLVLHAAKLSTARGYRLFLLGAAPGVAERAALKLMELFPGCQIAGTYSPPEGEFSPAENARMVEMVRAARTDALFVALGAPKQDEWIKAHLEELQVPLCAGIGGVFNFLAGETRRAPVWMQQAGLEWAFRLMQEPSRLWRRYLVNDLPIFFELLMGQLANRSAGRTPGRVAAAPIDTEVLAALELLDRPRSGIVQATTPLRRFGAQRVRARRRSLGSSGRIRWPVLVRAALRSPSRVS
jgi:N-acetylglucosaminyldiphosphoundecaprenol N-acetyl-beta-D-mannosaminyltransferase